MGIFLESAPRMLRLASVKTLFVVVAACGGDQPETVASVPTVQITSPATPLAIAPGVPVDISWRVTAASGAAYTEIFADRDGDLTTTADQLALGSTALTGASNTLTWDTTAAPLGTWQILARTSNDAGVGTSSSPAAIELAAPRATLTNLEPNEQLRYRLALLVGTTDAEVESIIVSNPPDSPREWPTSGGYFKALVPLREGDNALRLWAGGVEQRVDLRYQESENPRFVRLVYVMAADGDGRFDAPSGEPNDLESAKRRFATAAELMQTFTAEKLNAEGLGRRTFRLERDAQGAPVVETFDSILTLAGSRAMDGNALWSHFYGELSGLPRRDQSIDVVLMSMTTWDPTTKAPLAHTALGGGRLGLFGTGALHTWAQSLDEVVERFSDARSIDTEVLFDDSGHRGRHWSNFATGVGATLHELGHCLSLPHPANGKGVMSREFDHFNRAFMVREPESDWTAPLDPLLPSDEIGWDRSAAVRLRFHRYLEPDARAYTSENAPEISQDPAEVFVSSSSGLRHISWLVNGSAAGHEEFLTQAPPSFTVGKEALKFRFPDATGLRVTAIDDQGNIAEAEIQLD